MSSEWKEYELGQIIDMSSKKVSANHININNYISTENMIADKGGITISSGLPAQNNYLEFKIGDVLFSNIRTYFKKIWQASFPGGASNDIIVFRTKNKQVLDQSFLYCLISNDNFIDFTITTAKGTKMPRGDRDAMKKFKFRIPLDVEEQKKIAAILNSLEQKVNFNQRINQTLETIAQTLFKSWFVDFDPVKAKIAAKEQSKDPQLAAMMTISGKTAVEIQQMPADKRKELADTADLFPDEMMESELGWIPKGWKVEPLKELVKIKYGKDHKKLLDGKIPVFGSGGIMRYADQFLCINESVLIPRKGSLNNVMYVDEPFWTVDTMFYTVMKRSSIAKFVYQFVKTLDLSSMNVGSAVPSMTVEILNAIPIVTSAENLAVRFDKIISSLYDMKKSYDCQNNTLYRLRDTLLPKLLTGEVEIQY